MITGLWGKKIGMTQMVANDDSIVPITVVDISGWLVTNVKTKERDGYEALQVGKIKKRYREVAFSPAWLKKLKKYFTFVREIKNENIQSLGLKVGEAAVFSSVLSVGDSVNVTGKTKGCGFAGVVKRHNFAGPRGSHGCTMGKKPGSIGSFATQGKVIKGKKLPGHMGNQKRMVQNLEVIKLDAPQGAVFVKGSIPGKSGSLVFVRKV